MTEDRVPTLRTAAENVVKWWDAAPPTFPEGEYVGPAIEGLRVALRSAQPAPPLDVGRLADAIDEHIESDCPRDVACDGSCAPLIEAIYARLGSAPSRPEPQEEPR